MVNSDHFFQYFSIDFLGEGIGGNAMDAVKKAVFVNEAIKMVLSLYQKGDNDKGLIKNVNIPKIYNLICFLFVYRPKDYFTWIFLWWIFSKNFITIKQSSSRLGS